MQQNDKPVRPDEPRAVTRRLSDGAISTGCKNIRTKCSGLSTFWTFILCMAPISAWADTACPAPPPYALLRQDEDYSYLRDAKCRRDFMDPIKFIPLSTQKDQYLSLGGDVREWYEAFQNANWGFGPQDKNGYLLQRISAYADWHLGDGIRLFGQLSSETEDGRNGGPRCVCRKFDSA